MKEKKCGKNWIYVLMTAVLLTGALDFSKGNAAEASQLGTETTSANSLEEEAVAEPKMPELMAESKSPKLTQLQIPQKMEIVIDPWEIDGKEQIYSEEYTVQNTGETPGILTLDFTCKVGSEAGLSFQEDQDGLRDSGEKRLHMKVLFGTGEEAVFTREGTRYQAELQPGETLSLKFTGEVNENAEDPWKDGDLEIEGMYSWEGETVQSDETLEGISETEKKGANDDIMPSGLEQNDNIEPVSPEQAGQDRTGEEQNLPGKEEQGGTGKEQILPGKPEQGTDKGNSLSGNELEE